MSATQFGPARCLFTPRATSLCTPLRLFHNSCILHAKRRARAEKKQRTYSRKAVASAKLFVPPPTPSPTPLTVTAAPSPPPTPTTQSIPTPSPAFKKGSVQEREKELLRYFGRARHHYDSVPLFDASAALQGASHAQACRVPLATLFPPRAVAEPSTTVKSAAADADAAPATPSTPDLFLGYRSHLSSAADYGVSRALSTRLNSSVDGNKLFGSSDVPLCDIAADTSGLWISVCAAWESVVRACALCHPPHPIPLAQSVCLLVCFAQSKETLAVGNAFRAIAAATTAQCQASRTARCAGVFAVVPVYVGVESVAASVAAHGLSSVAKKEGNAGDGRCVTYPAGGLYTCAAVTQCLARVQQHTCTTDSTGTHSLTPQVFLLSDAWLNVRTVADLCSGREETGRGENSDSLQQQHSPPLSFLPDASRERVHVFPGVVSEPLSEREREAFATYLWSTMVRVCAQRSAAAVFEENSVSRSGG